MIQKYSAEILNMDIRETVSFCCTYPFSELMGSITRYAQRAFAFK